ncbi:MAG: hypothetical protein O9336_00660 [Microcystis sp. LE19-98.1E]|nr:hypothetical protein [Microcystis sp. LE19-98.1E]
MQQVTASSMKVVSTSHFPLPTSHFQVSPDEKIFTPTGERAFLPYTPHPTPYTLHPLSSQGELENLRSHSVGKKHRCPDLVNNEGHC